MQDALRVIEPQELAPQACVWAAWLAVASVLGWLMELAF